MKQPTRCPMNLHLIRLVAIFALGTYVSPAPGQEDSPDPAGRPRIEIEPKSLNLGAIFLGDKGKGEVTIRNTGTATLNISRVKSSCGCTAAFLNDRARRIEPGGSSVLPVTMKPKKSPRGDIFKKTLTIFSDDPLQPALPISVECQVMLGVDVSPASAVFRKMQHGEVRTVELTLTSYTEEPFRITSIDELPGPVILDYDKDLEALKHKVMVVVGPYTGSDKMHARLNIHTTHSKTKLVETMLLVEPEKLVEVVPNWLNLGRHDPGEIVEKQVTIRAAGGRKLETIEARVTRFPIEVTVRRVESGEPDQWVLSFKVPEDMAGRKLISPLELTTNIKEAGPVRVNMSLKINAQSAAATDKPAAAVN